MRLLACEEPLQKRTYQKQDAEQRNASEEIVPYVLQPDDEIDGFRSFRIDLKTFGEPKYGDHSSWHLSKHTVIERAFRGTLSLEDCVTF
jgi:hypothetical protein